MYSDDSNASAVYFYGWCADYPDPQNWLSVYWRSTTYFAQRINFKDDVFDQMVDKADAELDNARRMSLYREAQQQLIGDVPGVMLWNDLYAYLVKPSVKGIIPTAQDAGWPGEAVNSLKTRPSYSTRCVRRACLPPRPRSRSRSSGKNRAPGSWWSPACIGGRCARARPAVFA